MEFIALDQDTKVMSHVVSHNALNHLKKKHVTLTITKTVFYLQHAGTKKRKCIILPGWIVLWHAVSTTWPLLVANFKNRALQNVDLSLHQQRIWTLQREHQHAYFCSIKRGAWETGLECWAPSNCCQDMPTASQPASTWKRKMQEHCCSFAICKGFYDQGFLFSFYPS